MDPTAMDLSGPSLPVPSGEVYDPAHAIATGKTGFIVSAAICLGVSSILVALRMFTKARVLKEFLLEDYAVLFAWLGTGAWYGINFAASANGKHQWEVAMSDLETYLKLINAILILYCPLAFLSKLSILLQLRRIFTARQRNTVWYLSTISIYLNLLFYLALFLLSIFQCLPRTRIWDPLSNPGQCLPLGALLIPPSAIVVLSDIWLLTLPVVVLWRLHIPFSRKLAITASFSLGLVSLLAAVMSIVYAVEFMRTDDETYAVYPVAMWAGVQLCTLVTAAAVPVLPRLWAWWRGEREGAGELVKNSALGRIASFRRRRRDTLDFVGGGWGGLESGVGTNRADTPIEIVKTTEVTVTSFKIDANAPIGQAV